MKRKGNLLLFVLIGIVVLGIGYAGLTAVNLVINGNATATGSVTQDDFKVYFNTFNANPSSKYITITSGGNSNAEEEIADYVVTSSLDDIEVQSSIASARLEATFNVSNLKSTGDTVKLNYDIINESESLSAIVYIDKITNSNSDYFSIVYNTTALDTGLVIKPGEVKQVSLTVKLKKQDLMDEVQGSFSVALRAEPVEEGKESEFIGSLENPVEPTVTTVSNATEFYAALNNNSKNNVVSLSSNLDLSNEDLVVIDEDTRIELNGNMVNLGANKIEVKDGAALTLEDTDGTGKIVADDILVHVKDNSTLVVRSGEYDATNFTNKGKTIRVEDNAKVIINGGTINGAYHAIGVFGDSQVVVNGGEINSSSSSTDKDANGTSYYAYAIKLAHGQLTVNGGTITGVHGAIALAGFDDAEVDGDAKLVVNDGTITVNKPEGKASFYVIYAVANSSAELNGGTFTNNGTNPLMYVKTSNYIDIYDGTYTVSGSTMFKGAKNSPINVRIHGEEAGEFNKDVTQYIVQD